MNSEAQLRKSLIPRRRRVGVRIGLKAGMELANATVEDREFANVSTTRDNAQKKTGLSPPLLLQACN
jgi:hypothetical protein